MKIGVLRRGQSFAKDVQVKLDPGVSAQNVRLIVGTFGRALDVRKINAQDGKLTAEVRGEVEKADDGF